MGYTQPVAKATCTIDPNIYPDVETLCYSIVDYLTNHPEELEDGHLSHYDFEDNADADAATTFRHYLTLDGENLTIELDSEEDHNYYHSSVFNYDSSVFEFLVNHIAYLQTSEQMEVHYTSIDTDDGVESSVSYYGQGGEYVTSIPMLKKNKILQVSEQIQEDLRSFASSVDDEGIFFTQEVLGQMCQIVVDNFTAAM